MIAAAGENTIIIGLSHRNLELLKENKPMTFDGTRIGLPEEVKIIIFSEETEQAMIDMLVKTGVVEPELADDTLQAAKMRMT
jgi:hypothetical protein